MATASLVPADAAAAFFSLQTPVFGAGGLMSPEAAAAAFGLPPPGGVPAAFGTQGLAYGMMLGGGGGGDAAAFPAAAPRGSGEALADGRPGEDPSLSIRAHGGGSQKTREITKAALQEVRRGGGSGARRPRAAAPTACRPGPPLLSPSLRARSCSPPLSPAAKYASF
jgi:hypothetical protein